MIITNSQQILIPKKVYIGDTAELSISFNYAADITDWNWYTPVNLKDYDIQDVKITKNGTNYYQIVIRFTPWKTGNIDFPDLELIKAGDVTAGGSSEAGAGQTAGGNLKAGVNPAAGENSNSTGETAATADLLLLQTDPIEIVSLVEQNKITGIQGAKSPMLIPGTTYKLYGFIIAVVLAILVIIRTLIKRKHIAQFIRERKLRRKNLKNKRKSLRLLSNLLKGKNGNSLSNKNFAAAIQNIMRNYLETRFDYPFTKSVASEIYKNYAEATNGISEEKKSEAIQKIQDIFIRTDYIRYGNSDDNSFTDEEKNQMIENLKSHIETLETLPPKVVDIH